jgi:hypothetical protein
MPQPWNFFILTIAVLSIITYLTYSNPIQYLPRQWQQTLPMSNAGKSGSYEAPILGCDEPEEDVVKDSYQVFLHKGYSLGQHKMTVGSAVDLATAIRNILNETASHGLYYDATLDENALAAVRADIGVDLVICDVRAHPD